MIQRVSGPRGVLRVGHITAATLGRWTLTPVADARGRYVLAAEARTVDPFWSTRHPQTLCLLIGTREMAWEGVTLVFSGGRAEGVVTTEQRRRQSA